MSTPSQITVNVRNVAVGGDGVGEVTSQADGDDSLLGITAFVPFAAVGEVVSARITQKKERYLKAEIVEIEQPGPSRVQATCPHYMVCGGCELQHISYDAQLEAKYAMISGALKAAKLPSTVVESLQAVVPSSPFHYRRRINLHVSANGAIGFYRSNSRSVVPLETCSVATTGIGSLLQGLQELGKEIHGKVSSLLLEEDAEGVIAVLKSPYALSKTETKAIINVARQYFDNVSLLAAGKEVGGIGRQILELPLNQQNTFSLRVPAGSFSQVNWEINLKLIEALVEAANISYGRPAYDMYAGAGNFSLPLARAGASVTAVECDARLASLGRDNLSRYSLQKKVDYVESSVEKFLQSQKSHPDDLVVVADPPRNGLGKLVPQCTFGERFLLVSCHLPSFVRDIKALGELGWDVEQITPFDMFAQTSYVEILAVLQKR